MDIKSKRHKKRKQKKQHTGNDYTFNTFYASFMA